MILREASWELSKVPRAKAAPIGVGNVVLQPREKAEAPVEWNRSCSNNCFSCSTHPGAPVGVVVTPGAYEGGEEINVVVETESPLPISLDEGGDLDKTLEEGDVATVYTLSVIVGIRNRFRNQLNRKGSEDEVKRIPNQKEGRGLAVIVRRIPLFSAHQPEKELPKDVCEYQVETMITNIAHGEGCGLYRRRLLAEWRPGVDQRTTMVRPNCFRAERIHQGQADGAFGNGREGVCAADPRSRSVRSMFSL
jgi:hypothetical protein